MRPEFEKRTANEITELMRERAAGYTPEWRFDPEHPDIGAALAAVYQKMQSSIDKNYGRLKEKYKTDFFNCLNTGMRPSAPARGYVVFGTSQETEGTELPAGAVLTTNAEDANGERISAETVQDVYVEADTLRAVYESSDAEDYIGKYYAGGEEESRAFRLFSKDADNLQEHCFYLSHPHALSIQGSSRIRLWFFAKRGESLKRELLEGLADREKAEFFYLTEKGEVPFEKVRAEQNCLVLEKREDGGPWTETELGGVMDCWMGCRIYSMEAFRELSFEELYIASECDAVLPEAVYAAGEEAADGSVFPFGEQFSIYGEVYFASREALSKKGAKIELSFDREFARVPLEPGTEGGGINWKLIMPKGDVRVEREYDITIEEVVWEYFNGSGWARLFPGREYSGIFGTETGTYRQVERLTFSCPEDISPVLVNASENYYIRARIIKINNMFKTAGQYISPVISRPVFRYRYDSHSLRPARLYRRNNRKEELYGAKEGMGPMRPFVPAYGNGDKEDTLYLGFAGRLERGPVRMLWVLGQMPERKQPELLWEYFSNGGWRRFHPADGTAGFTRTGLVSFDGMPDGKRSLIFGEELYWIRIRNMEQSRTGGAAPELRQLWMNASEAVTIRSGLTERFTMERYEAGVSFSLLYRNIHSLSVWVREDAPHSREELSQLEQERRLEQIRDESGTVAETWVRWRETDQFAYEAPTARCYLLDANSGTLTFGGAQHGRIPAPGVLDGIQVRYSTGGGECCNLMPGAVTGLELSTGFINFATNPLAFSGGYDREAAGDAMARAGRALQHGGRAVSADDILALAFEAGRNIEKAACFSGMDGEGKRKGGAVTLVVLQKNYGSGNPYFPEFKAQLFSFLRERLPAGLAESGRFFITEPLLVEIELSIEAEVESFQDIFPARRKLLERLSRFLDPQIGNFGGTGWKIGSLPEQDQLRTVIQDVPEITVLKSCVIFAYLRNRPGRPEQRLEEIRKHPYVLPVNGSHRIRIQTGH